MRLRDEEVTALLDGKLNPFAFLSVPHGVFSGKFGKELPYEVYSCSVSTFVKRISETNGFEGGIDEALQQARRHGIHRFVSVANDLARWEWFSKAYPELEGYVRFTDTGMYNMRGIGEKIADGFGLEKHDAAVFDRVKWFFTIDYEWHLYDLLRFLHMTDDRDKDIPAIIKASVENLIEASGKSPCSYSRFFAEAYVCGYLHPRNSDMQAILSDNKSLAQLLRKKVLHELQSMAQKELCSASD